MTESSVKLGIPIIHSKSFAFDVFENDQKHTVSWNFYFYEEFAEHFQDESVVKEEFHFLTKISLDETVNGYRRQFYFKTIPFLIGIIPDKKAIHFLSPRAHQESFILDKFFIKDLSEPEIELFNKLKAHAEEVLKLNLYKFPSVIQQITTTNDLCDLDDKKYLDCNEDINKYRHKLTKYLEEYSPTLFERVSDYGLTLTANFDLIRIHLLKFVAILASLEFDKEGTEVKRLLVEALRRLLEDSTKAQMKGLKGTQRPLPRGLFNLFWLAKKIALFLPPKLLTHIVKFIIKKQARRFIAGENIEQAEKSLRELLMEGRDATLDQLGELVVSKKEADNYKSEVIKLIKGFSQYVEPGEKNASGIYRAHVSIKVSALSNDFNPEAFEHTYKTVYPRLKEILITAKLHKVYLNIDAEHYSYRDMVLEIYKRTLLETDELKDYDQTGIVLQGYLRDAYRHLKDVIALAKERNITMPIRLVKGAYWDAETIEAEAHSYDAPEFLNKEETDIHYRQLMIEILENYPYVQLCLGGHNLRDHCFGEVVREKYYPKTPIIEHQCLHMTFEALSVGMRKMGWVSRNYVPIGSLLVGMAYLVRRIMENSSQVGVLTQMRSHKNYEMVHPQTLFETLKERKQVYFDKSITRIGNYFFNIAPVQLFLEYQRKFWKSELQNIVNSFGSNYKNNFQTNGEILPVFSSSVPDVKVGEIQQATKSDVLRAIEQSELEYKSGLWSNWPFHKRASILLSVASELLSRRLELSALIVYEAGKSQDEALADVDEAIDFLNFYARQGDKFSHQASRGVVAVISPWNFPIAIPTGMISGPLICGNTVILKSAEETPLIAQRLVEIFHRHGVPQNALIHLPGDGENIGASLVDSPKISSFVFTGSKAVGVMIARKCSGRIYINPKTGRSYPVKVITEMGGKNAIIVTANAELDETVDGVLYSAFAHAGQKCSACSRVIIDNRIKDIFIDRFKEAANDLEVGAAFNEETYINPLISKGTKDRVKSQARKMTFEAKEHGGKVLVNRAEENTAGHSVGPVVIELPKYRGFEKDSYSQIELFAPVVHILGYDTHEEAVELFNATPYGLTGGIFSQSQDDIDFFSEQIRCGNLYVNRGNTGARVGIEPFGGFKLSGTGPKAGSHYYLGSFVIDPDDFLPEINIENNTTLGSDYDFDLAVPSQLGQEKLTENFIEGLGYFLNQFEDIYQGIFATTKGILIDYKAWAQENLLKFLNEGQANVYIPGQMNFDNYLFKKEKIVFISNDLNPNPKTLLTLINAVGVGVGITIVCKNHANYLLWSRFVDCFHAGGISDLNLSVYHVSERRYLESLKHPEVEGFIIDGNLDIFSETSEEVYKSYDSDKSHFIPKFITPFDCPETHEFQDYVLMFVDIRSFAINTMRHGAPLEIDL